MAPDPKHGVETLREKLNKGDRSVSDVDSELFLKHGVTAAEAADELPIGQ